MKNRVQIKSRGAMASTPASMLEKIYVYGLYIAGAWDMELEMPQKKGEPPPFFKIEVRFT